MRALSAARLLEDSDRYVKTLTVFRSAGQRLVEALAFNGQFPDRRGVVQPKLYRHLRRGEACWNYLMLAGVPQTTGQIWAAVEELGACQSKAIDGLKATYSALYYSKKFVRFGLKHWTIAK